MTTWNTESRTKVGQKNECSTSTVTPDKIKLNPTRAHESYWKSRLRQRSSKDYQIKIKVGARQVWFNTHTPSKDAAALIAKRIYVDLCTLGAMATLAKYKEGNRPEPAANDLSIGDFCRLFRERRESVDEPVSLHTGERYIKSLNFVCRKLGITRLAALTEAEIEKFKDDYLAQGRKEKRDVESVKVSLNTMLRNAGALFSKYMLPAYAAKGYKINNPFHGQQVRGVKLQTYEPVDQPVYDSIWRDAVLLRDGDPNAKAPKASASRWDKHDFRKSNLAAYALLLLTFGLGLRRNEADKAQKDWLYTSGEENYLRIQQTPFFKPKSKESRTIHVDPELYAELKRVMDSHVSPFIVPGHLPKQHEPGKEPKNIVYRCDAAHRALTAWLRARGFTDSKPIHQARKEFGSFVANDPTLGLFAAQKLLGHSSPTVTAQHYAGLKVPKVNNVKLSNRRIA
jgi:integrase